MQQASAIAWAQEEFGRARLGDARRTARLVRMAREVAIRPAGRVSEVFEKAAERQGAYDLLENPAVQVEQLQEAAAAACAARSAEYPFVFVPVDGSSLTLTDHARTKDFGAIGANMFGARGLKVISAIGVSPEGVPVGLLSQQWWSRKAAPKRRNKKRRGRDSRKVEEKETQHWLDAIEDTTRRLEEGAPRTRAWFQLDREADAWPQLIALTESGHDFTVRASWNRRVHTDKGTRYLRDIVKKKRILGTYDLPVPAGPGRSERVARMAVRVAIVTLDLRDRTTGRSWALSVNVVWSRELRTTPRGEKPLDWLLFTSAPCSSFEQACRVIFGYGQRWRIEEFHRTWKSGACKVEETQLHDAAHVKKWATVLATVALRIERLKYLSRKQPDLPASVELSAVEIRTLLLLKRAQKKRNETIPDTTPTIALATRWIAELGGYTGKSSGGPPGSITIRRGLDEIRAGARVLEALESQHKM
jgi:hypothetical protein